NVHEKSEPAAGSASSAVTGENRKSVVKGERLSGLTPPNVLEPSTVTLATVTVTVSVRSASTTFKVPVAVNVVSVSVAAPVISVPVMSGASLVPVIVIVTICVSLLLARTPESSVALSVYFRTSVSPSARKLNAPSPLMPDVNVHEKSEPAAGSASSAVTG